MLYILLQNPNGSATIFGGKLGKNKGEITCKHKKRFYLLDG